MNLKFLFLMAPILLTGCIGSLISGHSGYSSENYPDIRTVPERPEASKPRGLHQGSEEISRATDFVQLEKDREQIKARDEAIREGAFSNSQEVVEN